MMRIGLIVLIALAAAASQSHALVSNTSGTVQFTATPYPGESDTTIFVFNEQQNIPFVSTQPLNFGAIVPGTLVNSHYLQLDTIAPTGTVGSGSVTFDGPIVGIITSTGNLYANLAPDAVATSDSYFGLESTLGPYPFDASMADRGLGSPEDDLIINIGSNTLGIDSLGIESNNRVDGIRVLTLVPEPASLAWLSLGGVVMMMRKRPCRR